MADRKFPLTAIVVTCLIVGAATGWVAAGSSDACPMGSSGGTMGGMHRMPDGSMMANMGGSGMGAMMMDMTARLEGKTGDALDRVFLEDMIVHHQGAVDMAELLAAGTSRPEMRKFAEDIIRVQSAEIAQMEAWQSAWFGR